MTGQFIRMAILVVMFVRDARSTLLSNARSALAQIMESQRLKEHLIDASEKSLKRVASSSEVK